MKIQKIILFILLFGEATFAQNQAIISGKITDATTGLPLAGAWVGIPSRGLGTLTNTDGDFVYRYPTVQQNENISVYLIDYQIINKKATDWTNGTVTLVPASVARLDSAYLKSHPAKSIVKKALTRIADNYPQNGYSLLGFYTETLQRDSAFARINEAVFKAEKRHNAPKDDLLPEKVKLLKGRTFEKPELLTDLDDFGFPNGALLVTHTIDMGIPEYLDRPNDYAFRLSTLLASADSRPCFRIEFSPAHKSVKGARQGTILIDTTSLAIVKIAYTLTPDGLNDLVKASLGSQLFGGKKVKISEFSGRYQYHLFNGKWYLQESGLGLIGQISRGNTRTSAEISLRFAVTEIQPKISTPLRESEHLQNSERFAPGGKVYGEANWPPFNFVKATEVMKSIVKD